MKCYLARLTRYPGSCDRRQLSRSQRYATRPSKKRPICSLTFPRTFTGLLTRLSPCEESPIQFIYNVWLPTLFSRNVQFSCHFLRCESLKQLRFSIPLFNPFASSFKRKKSSHVAAKIQKIDYYYYYFDVGLYCT